MKVWHLVHGRPIGPTFKCYITPPDIDENDPDDMYGTWLEETTLEEVSIQFAKHVAYMAEQKVSNYFPYELIIDWGK